MKNKGSETFLEARIMVLSLKWTMWLLNDVQQYVVKRNTRFLNSGGKEGNEKLAWKELELQWSRKEIRKVRNTHLLIKGAFFLCFCHTQLLFPSVPHPSKLFAYFSFGCGPLKKSPQMLASEFLVMACPRDFYPYSVKLLRPFSLSNSRQRQATNILL